MGRPKTRRVVVFDEPSGCDMIGRLITGLQQPSEEAPCYQVWLRVPFDRFGLDEWGVGLSIKSGVVVESFEEATK
jgi:hypothetical protein